MRAAFLILVAAVGLSGCRLCGDCGELSPVRYPASFAEATGFLATSSYADVTESLDLSAAFGPIHLRTFGESGEGRALPLAVWNAPDASPDAVRAAGTTRVLVVANIHGGEVAGKEAALELVRDLALGNHHPSFEALTILVAPLYNADGNEAMGLDHRPLQLGPVEGMGLRPNAAGLDLNRDLMKAAAPETRALLGVFEAYDPHVVLDLHTTDGTAMDYGLTYAPGLSPNTPAPLDALLRDEWLPAVSADLLDRYDLPTYHYGNVPGAFGEPATAPRGWYTFSPAPRFLTNYVGLRGRLALLSEAYSYSPFARRVADTGLFVNAVLGRVAADAERVRTLVAEADAASAALAGTGRLALRADYDALPEPVEIWLSRVDTVAHPVTGAPQRRDTGERIRETMPAFVRFAPTTTERVPSAYLVPRSPAVTEILDAHGIAWSLAHGWGTARQRFEAETVELAERPFQGVRMQTATGAWADVPAETRDPPRLPARIRVDMAQPLARVAFMLLEPTSPDGLVAWGVLHPDDGAGIERIF